VPHAAIIGDVRGTASVRHYSISPGIGDIDFVASMIGVKFTIGLDFTPCTGTVSAGPAAYKRRTNYQLSGLDGRRTVFSSRRI